MKREVELRGRTLDRLYFFCTTCPKRAKHCGENNVDGIAKLK